MKDVEPLLRSQLGLQTDGLAQLTHTMPDQKDTVSTSKEITEHSMNKTYALSLHKHVKSNMLPSVDKTVSWSVNFLERSSYFVRVIQVHSHREESSFQNKITVPYRGHLVMESYLKKFGRFFTFHELTFVVLGRVSNFELRTSTEDTVPALKQSDIPLSAVVLLLEEVPSTSSRGASDMKLELIFKAVHRILGCLNDNARKMYPLPISGKLRHAFQ